MDTLHSISAAQVASTAYWLSERTWYIVSTPELDTVRLRPRSLGLEDRDVIRAYSRHGAVDDSAREELIQSAMVRGWVRIVEHRRPVSYLSVECYDYPRGERLILDFLHSLIDEYRPALSMELHLHDLAWAKRRVYPARTGGVARFLEEHNHRGV
jgi:hypothetical protein